MEENWGVYGDNVLVRNVRLGRTGEIVRDMQDGSLFTTHFDENAVRGMAR